MLTDILVQGMPQEGTDARTQANAGIKYQEAKHSTHREVKSFGLVSRFNPVSLNEMHLLTAVIYPDEEGEWLVAQNPETGTTTQG